MIKSKLNLSLINTKINISGLSQAAIAKELDVSRESVSKWFSGENFPRARHLLKLGEILKLTYAELVIEEPDEFEPIFAFSAAHNYEHNDTDKEKVMDIGYSLEKLIPYLPKKNEGAFKSTLLNPKNDILYLQDIVSQIKHKYHISLFFNVDDLIKIFNDYNAYLVPVLWGAEENKSNGIHIKLPESGTDWIYINLDSFVYDIKFWLLHEFAHMLAPDYQVGKYAEDFANSFAAEFLFPLKEAESISGFVSGKSVDEVKITLFDKANELVISPYTIYKQLNKYLESIGSPAYDIPEVVNSFKSYLPEKNNVSVIKSLLQKDTPTAQEYLNLFEEKFNDSFVESLCRYYRDKGFSIGFIKNIFHISLQDAQNIFDDISKRNIDISVSCN